MFICTYFKITFFCVSTRVHMLRQARGGPRAALGVSSNLTLCRSRVSCCFCCYTVYSRTAGPQASRPVSVSHLPMEVLVLQIGSPHIAFPLGFWIASLGIRLLWVLFSTHWATSQPIFVYLKVSLCCSEAILLPLPSECWKDGSAVKIAAKLFVK